jgi:class 3 adenylate cyclase
VREALSAFKSARALEQKLAVGSGAASLEKHDTRAEMRQVAAELSKQIDDAKREREQAERVLFTVLPRPIAERMTKGESRIAEEIPDVSVLFADLAGFTALSTRTSPWDLLEMLDAIFSEFDRLTAAHGLEKVKTIGMLHGSRRGITR